MNIASHELKTPITSLKGYLRLLAKSGKVPERVNVFLQKASVQADRVANLINDLLDVSRIQAGKISLDITPFNFHELVVEVASCMQMGCNTHQIKIVGASDGTVNADRIRMEQVLVNLLGNAIKYSPQASHIEIRSFKKGQWLEVEVTDFGIGLHPEIPHIFDRFFRVYNVVTKFAGLGIGLFITKEVILRHHGEIGVVSEPNKGSTFWFRLPLANN
jgi:signal transduction histidine kinase